MNNSIHRRRVMQILFLWRSIKHLYQNEKELLRLTEVFKKLSKIKELNKLNKHSTVINTIHFLESILWFSIVIDKYLDDYVKDMNKESFPLLSYLLQNPENVLSNSASIPAYVYQENFHYLPQTINWLNDLLEKYLVINGYEPLIFYTYKFIAIYILKITDNQSNKIIARIAQISSSSVKNYFKLMVDFFQYCKCSTEYNNLNINYNIIADFDEFKQQSILNNRIFKLIIASCTDGTLINISRKGIKESEYQYFYSYKKQLQITGFYLTNYNLQFVAYILGFPGNCNDFTLQLYAQFCYPNCLPKKGFVLGDAGFKLDSFILTPYRGVRYHLSDGINFDNIKDRKEAYNYYHSSNRISIERTFGLLKKRSKILSQTNPNFDLKFYTKILDSCLIIQNIDRHFKLLEATNKNSQNNSIDDRVDTENGQEAENTNDIPSHSHLEINQIGNTHGGCFDNSEIFEAKSNIFFVYNELNNRIIAGLNSLLDYNNVEIQQKLINSYFDKDLLFDKFKGIRKLSAEIGNYVRFSISKIFEYNILKNDPEKEWLFLEDDYNLINFNKEEIIQRLDSEIENLKNDVRQILGD
ncbi:uncharacterized protein SCDLUD_001764 [Saccharomycodes ludwigii]|uniref:uncharacterized protein n=1 Tax=Saccharomycodes ludwigii TaxID=36035 RepID=UPI001E85B28C|nr:hypothetical protein SCDLUD_001764 [Saccharomycodes ludwigii]KAH3901976.1 hypothetical protein SCDLUD_001764 [Saccharomycodes ludwigii]